MPTPTHHVLWHRATDAPICALCGDPRDGVLHGDGSPGKPGKLHALRRHVVSHEFKPAPYWRYYSVEYSPDAANHVADELRSMGAEALVQEQPMVTA